MDEFMTVTWTSTQLVHQVLNNYTYTDLEAKEVTLQPEGDDFKNDAQKNRNDVEDGVDGSFEDLFLVNVLAGCVEVEHRPRNQHCYQL